MGDLTNLKKDVADSGDLTDGPFGTPLLRGGGTPFYFDPANGVAGARGRKPLEALSTLAAAYALTTTDLHDVIYYISHNTISGTNHHFSAAFTWARHSTHLIGVGPGNMVGPRSRFFQLSTATGVSPMVTVSGNNNYFANLEFFQGVDDANSLICMKVTGNRNHFHNCQISGAGHNTIGDEADACSLEISGAENLFTHCYIGLDTIARSDASTEIELSGTSAQRNVFENCIIRSWADSADHVLLRLGAGCLGGGFLLFKDCLFLNDIASIKTGALALTTAVDSVAAPNGMIIFQDCTFVGCTDITDDATGVVMLGHSSNDYADYSAGVGLAVAPS
jgi:hypothetical protein